MPEELMTATADGEQLDTQEVTEQVETGDTGLVTDDQQTETQTPPERTFTQAQLDEIVQRRIAKEQSRFENERVSAAQQARDSYIAEQGYTWKGRPITTEAEYKAALEEQEIENMIQSRGYDPDEIAKVVSAHPEVKRATEYLKQQEESQRQAQAQQDFASRRDSMYEEFLEDFPDQDFEAIPQEVWTEANKWLQSGGREGRRLADALTRHNDRQRRAQEQANDANSANAAASTGSVKAQAPPKGPLTEEMVEAMTDKERMARWPEIRKLYGMK